MQICKILLKYLLRHDKITLGSAIDGRRFALSGGTVTLRLHRNPKGNLGKEGKRMLTIEGLIAVISLCITCFSLGYTIGSRDKDKTQK